MTPQVENALARCLTDIGLSLGEYMELMEEAYIQAAAELGDGDCGRATVNYRAQVLAGQRLRSYAGAKRLLALARPGALHWTPMLVQGPPGADPFSAPVVGDPWIVSVDRVCLHARNRRLIRAMRDDCN
jgi:hypothetical protein